MPELRHATVVIVEGEAHLRDALEVLFASTEYSCLSYDSAEAFLQHDLPAPPCCLLLDLQLPGMSGLELQARLRETKRPAPIVFVSACATSSNVAKAINAGALDFLSKPFDSEQLLTATRRGLRLSLEGA